MLQIIATAAKPLISTWHSAKPTGYMTKLTPEREETKQSKLLRWCVILIVVMPFKKIHECDLMTVEC